MESTMKGTFAERIVLMNSMYGLPVHSTPTIPENVQDRLKKFNEIDDIVKLAADNTSQLDIAVAIADLLGDVIIYCRSEALKYGIPLEQVLDLIMDSNESKLDADGHPIYDANGKFLKGPNYWRAEPKIRELLDAAST
jgi:predicted HAD superfamily Cof-like phosphohydrolase